MRQKKVTSFISADGDAVSVGVSVSQLAKETTSTTKNVNIFLMRDFYFKRPAWKRLTLVIILS